MKTRVADRCGCATGALFMAVGLIASLVYYGWQFQVLNLPLSSVAIRITAVTFGSASAGKIAGMLRSRWLTAD